MFESLLRLFGFEPVKCLCKRGWKCRVVIMTGLVVTYLNHWAIVEPWGLYKRLAWHFVLAFSYKMHWDKE